MSGPADVFKQCACTIVVLTNRRRRLSLFSDSELETFQESIYRLMAPLVAHTTQVRSECRCAISPLASRTVGEEFRGKRPHRLASPAIVEQLHADMFTTSRPDFCLSLDYDPDFGVFSFHRIPPAAFFITDQHIEVHSASILRGIAQTNGKAISVRISVSLFSSPFAVRTINFSSMNPWSFLLVKIFTPH